MARASRWLQGAERALQDERWDDAVYAAQMCSEHAAKAVLIALGIEYPKQHDVSGVFIELKRRGNIPAEFGAGIEEVTASLGELAAERALAGYGFEEGVDASYFEDYAPEAVEKARSVRDFCNRLLGALFGAED